ncbi:sulfatase family protein [Algibacter pacificus]|uniref:sulfatase family protein n=1 Tax=Algibacter pacificus TaxID=2599389 RepID=UPI0011CB32EB|nr:sulfatase [Algibacter pacificus]
MKPLSLAVAFLFCINSIYAQVKPNILWITIEDTSPQFIGCYGNKDASTPVIDKLAKEGIRFTNAFSTGTVCSSSRSTIITGVPTYKMGTGNHRSNFPIPKFIKGFPHYLKAQGYYTSNNVKTDYNIAKEKDFIRETWNQSSNTASWKNRNKEQPFFSVFNFAESHQSRTMSMPFEWYEKNVWNQLSEYDKIADHAFKMPPFYKDTPQMRKQFARVYNAIKLTDNKIGQLLKKLEDENLKENTIIFFFADHGEGIPRAKTNGINLGYRVPLVIWFPEKFKHLSPWGKAGTVSEELITFEDLAPTIISMTGGHIPEYLKGRILIGDNRSKEKKYVLLSSDRADNGIDLTRTITDGRFVYSRNFMPFMPEMRYIRYIEMADITKHMRSDFKNNKLNTLQKSIFKPRPAEVLYDIKNDIWETKNLVGNPEYKDVLITMRNQLNKEIHKIRDAHFMPEYQIELVSKTQTVYEYRLDKDKYPFKNIYEAANLSGKQGENVAKAQLKLLKKTNNIERYWGAVGLLSQNKSSIVSFKSELIKGLDDEYPPVAITVAAILYKHFKNHKAMQVLSQFCQNDNMDLALMAINYLLYEDNKAPFIDIIKAVHKAPKSNYNVKAASMDFLEIMKIEEYRSATKH